MATEDVVSESLNASLQMYGLEASEVLPWLVASAIVATVIGIALHIYFAITLMTIGRKLKYKHSWLAWIPFANFAMLLELGDFHWAWVFLLLGIGVPIVGILFVIAVMILATISLWRISEKRDFPGWTSLLGLIPGLGLIWIIILMGILAWKD